MHKFLILVVLSCFIFQGEEESIIWSEDLELQWSDFRGEPKPQGDTVASTASGISFGYSSAISSTGIEDFTYNITAHFYPDKSWSVKGPLKAIVLDHERLHFDITELHARKFKQRIANTKFSLNIKSELGKIHNAINVELAAMQKKYDAETSHSIIEERQLEWQSFIAKELDELANYK